MIRELTAHLWQSTLFALAAGLLTLACRQNRAKVRYWLWLSASLKFFLPFALLIGLGGRLGWGPVAQRIASPDVSIAVERLALPFAEPLPMGSAAPAAPAAVSWTRFAIPAVWLAGLVAIALIRLRLWLRIRAAVRASTPLDIPAAVEVRSAPGLLEPGVVGLLRPILLLPEGIVERLTPSQLEAVLAHELCHVRRRDNLFAASHMLVEALFWFHPLVWWIGTRLVEERERACDEGVLTLGNEPRVYADAILSVCKLYVESPLQCVAGVTGADLKRRIEAIMTNRTGRGLDLARKLLLVSAGVAAVAGPVAIGVLIGVGNAPAVHAQSPAVEPPAPSRTAPDTPQVQVTPAPATENKYQDRRLVALLFDFESMTPDDQARAQQAAISFVRKMQPAGLAALITTNGGEISVVQDFTDDRAALESAIQKFSPTSTGSAPNESLRLARLESAVRMLGVLSNKKELVYFASGSTPSNAQDPAQMQAVVNSAIRANVALYPVDTSAKAAQAQPPQQSAESRQQLLDATLDKLQDMARRQQELAAQQTPPPGVSSDEYDRRRAYAQQHFGSLSIAIARTYIRYGAPDQIEQGQAGAQSTQVWHYNYLENFHGRAEFEFSLLDHLSTMHIKWPPPTATFAGTPGAPAALAMDFARGGRGQNAVVSTISIAGLPGGHASMQTYPAGVEQTLTVPLDSLSGQIDILGQVNPVPNTGAGGALLQDHVRFGGGQSKPGPYQANFTLPAGSYVCSFVVKEQTTGRVYGETINFEVQ